MKKQVVKYSALLHTPVIGESCMVVPADHPDTINVTNGELAYTSRVVSYDEATGLFETQNTVYVPE